MIKDLQQRQDKILQFMFVLAVNITIASAQSTIHKLIFCQISTAFAVFI